MSLKYIKKEKNIIAIIPARGGSKGIPDKNLIDFCGKPLLAWTILQANNSKTIDQIYVSSNDKKILEVSSHYGAVPILRPEKLASDTSSSEETLLHALNEIEEIGGNKADIVVFLQATSPLREPHDIDEAVNKLIKTKSDSLLSVAILDDLCAFKLEVDKLIGITYDPFNRGVRQDRDPFYHDNGSIYVFRPEILMAYNNRLGGKIAIFEMPLWKSYEIDTTEDIDICTYFFRKNLLKNYGRNSKIKPITESNIKLIVYDFDGVMTNNHVIVLEDGTEGIIANRGDGMGVVMIEKQGIKQVVLSSERNPVVKTRVEKLNIPVLHNIKDKAKALQKYCSNNNVELKHTAFIGHDINDYEAMKLVGFPISPADAHPKVKEISKIVLNTCGGDGVIRELADLLTDGWEW